MIVATSHGSALGCLIMLAILFVIAVGPGLASYYRNRKGNDAT